MKILVVNWLPGVNFHLSTTTKPIMLAQELLTKTETANPGVQRKSKAKKDFMLKEIGEYVMIGKIVS